jgi:phospholipid transport system substrate-binding protein
MKKTLVLGLLLCLLGLWGGGPVWATARPPQQVVQETSTQMLEALRKNREVLREDPGRLYGLVNQIILPNFDFDLISRWVLGQAWRQATPAQRRQFAQEFQTLLVRTYSNALLEYLDEDFQLLPARGAVSGDEATVRTEIRLSAGQPIPIHYRMHLRDGTWKIIDVTVEGISLVTNYRSTFASQIRSSGLDAVIADLRQRNAELGR